MGPASGSAPVPVLDSRYAVRGQLGSGGRSVVWLADDRLLSRQVAIKVFRANAESREALEEQEREAKLIASMNHYALTTLFDAGVDTTDPARPQIYLVMEYIPGRDLKQRLLDGPLEWFQVCWLGRDLAEGLQYLHELGFLHRDIKPANVLLATRHADVRLRGKLTDFGLSSLVGSDGDSEYVTGTAAYLAPEQVEGRGATAASDIYSLGLVLLEALTGQVAYPGGVEESAFARLDNDPAIPSSIPARVRAVLRSMTSLEPKERPALAEVAAVFQNLLIDDLVRQRGYAVSEASDTSEHRPLPATALSADGQEAERVAALRRYDAVGKPSDPNLDRISRLAAEFLGVPYAAVSFVDADRIWMQSRQGIEEEQLDREVAACVLRTEPGAWTVPDMREDPLTRSLPMVLQDGGPRSYAAAPLVTFDGHALGSLCAFAPEVRVFTANDLRVMTDLAAIVMNDLELRLAMRRALFDR
ncbi:protein kinase domain-containing protein [Amnibacterium endophyticum]|uniref:non-specific serine/threonine protein kinase n=1 Tax=Amnibacterium endophyticum TaxID=2109337 RepID=A0ABW4LIK6_9MICO